MQVLACGFILKLSLTSLEVRPNYSLQVKADHDLDASVLLWIFCHSMVGNVGCFDNLLHVPDKKMKSRHCLNC